MKRNYYVYAHQEGSKIVYIGIGRSCRAFRATGSGQRNPEHRRWLEERYNQGNIPIVFLHTGLSKPEALEMEAALIKDHLPIFNHNHNPRHYKNKLQCQEDLILSLRDMGYSYGNIAYLIGAEHRKHRDCTKIMSVWRFINEFYPQQESINAR